jgi:hypothetical protein
MPEETMMNLAYPYTQSLRWVQTMHQWLPPLRWNLSVLIRSETVSEQTVQQRNQAFHCAYQLFAQAYPDWTKRGFNADLLRQTLAPLLAGRRETLPTGMKLACQWDAQFGMLSPTAERARYLATLAPVADHFLRLLTAELDRFAGCGSDQNEIR